MKGSTIERLLHRALTHPVSMAAKGVVRDLWWALPRPSLANPPAPGRIRSVLFVCKGNICRSPFGAARMRQLLKQMDISGVVCDSAGLDTTQAARPPKEACAAAARFGLSLDGHRPLQVTPEVLAQYDLIVVMESAHRRALTQKYADIGNRILLLPLLNRQAAGYARYNIADPYGQPIATFQSCYSRMDEALGTLMRDVIAPTTAPRFKTGTGG
jgi:protein-tyrosine phosphatase